jgi:type IV pilus assembly protein PilC
MLYYYAARSSDGVLLRGSLQATNAQEALSVLNNRGLFVSLLDESASVRGLVSGILQMRPVSQNAVVAFFRSLATLTRAGVSLSRSITICAEQTGDSRLREALRGVAAELQNGRSLSEAMLTRPREFSHLAAASIKAGEQSGTLDEMLAQLATGLERDRALRKKLVSALTYPAIVLVATVGIVLLVLTTTVPIFQNMYEQLRVEMPPVLQILVSAGALLRSSSFMAVVAGTLCTIVLVAIGLREDQRGARLFEALELALPIAGTIVKKAATGRFARLLGMLLSCGVSINDAIPIVAQATHGPRFRSSVEALRRSLYEGSPIAPSLEACELYEPFFIQLVRVGEETGTVSEMLLKIADYYELEVEAALQQLGTALEPILIILLGGIVGAIAAAVFIPLYSLIGSIK